MSLERGQRLRIPLRRCRNNLGSPTYAIDISILMSHNATTGPKDCRTV